MLKWESDAVTLEESESKRVLKLVQLGEEKKSTSSAMRTVLTVRAVM